MKEFIPAAIFAGYLAFGGRKKKKNPVYEFKEYKDSFKTVYDIEEASPKLKKALNAILKEFKKQTNIYDGPEIFYRFNRMGTVTFFILYHVDYKPDVEPVTFTIEDKLKEMSEIGLVRNLNMVMAKIGKRNLLKQLGISDYDDYQFYWGDFALPDDVERILAYEKQEDEDYGDEY